MVGQVGHRLKALISSTMVKNLGKEEKKKKKKTILCSPKIIWKFEKENLNVFFVSKRQMTNIRGRLTPLHYNHYNKRDMVEKKKKKPTDRIAI